MATPKKAASKKKADGSKKVPGRKVTETFEDEVGDGKTQGRLIAREKDDTLEDLANKVDDLQSKRMAMQAKEQTARGELTDYMKKHQIAQYDLPGEREAVLDLSEPKAKVHKIVTKKAPKSSE